MTNFLQRSLTGFGLVVVIITCIEWGPYPFLLLCLVIGGFALHEYYELISRLQVRPRKYWGIALSVSLLTASFFITGNRFDWQIILLCIPLATAIFLLELYSIEENPFQRLAFTFLGITWITLPMIFFNSTAFLPFWAGTYQKHILLAYFFMLWSYDTGAYLVGTWLGSRKLFPAVSPKKTWEGSIGGACFSLIIAYFISRYFTELSTRTWLGMAVLIVVFGTYGDLLKSLLKRSVNVKDSGTLLPGHGGFLDRFDSLMGSAPFVFAYLAIILNG